ncbi:MAG: hypothetical protein Q4Q62_01895 [Thermoplasmata archaeon]|nr:hypothetical protein [Thermoplasmata archaeon]
MERAESHLEDSLNELNGRVNALEAAGPSVELMEAYVNRGAVLAMMEYRLAALDDLDSAGEILSSLDPASVDAGTFVKIHTTRAALVFDQGGDPVEEYAIAATRLRELRDGSLHFDRRGIVRMCISACENLIDAEHGEDCGPFLERGLAAASGSDRWSENRRMDLQCLAAESADSVNDVRGAMEWYSEAIETGTRLMESGSLDDTESLVMALVLRAGAEADLGMEEVGVTDLTVAVQLLEGLLEAHGLPDKEPLIALHHDLAGALMKIGRVEEAEKHLIRAMEIGVGQYAGEVDIDVHLPDGSRLRRVPNGFIANRHSPS